MRFLKILITGSVLVILYFQVCQAVIKYNVIARTNHGPVEGYSIPSHYSAYPRKRINCFLGVPYAKRIIQYGDWRREFRFNKPDRPHWEGTWDATAYRPACPQLPWLVRQTVPSFERSKDTSEDCLYLNIFAPNKTDERDTAYPPLYPVLVFFHGGGFVMGASQQYPGIFLAERNVVVVIVNYRLNALGFLSTGDHFAPGNYGLWDQRRALEFVKENIQAFRGNPGMVTIFGQSTGAASVGLHLLSPRSVGLYSQAILMSGSDRCAWSVVPRTDYAADYARQLGQELGCPTNDNQRLITCLQLYRTADEIVNASAKVRIVQGTVGNPWGPVVDGPYQGSVDAFLPDFPRAMRDQGRYQKPRVMLGVTRDEGAFFIPNMPSLENGITPTQFDNIIREFVNDRGVFDVINTMEAIRFEYTYWPQKGNYSWIRQELMDLMSDYIFNTGMEETARYQKNYNETYFYVFNYRSRFDYMPEWRGVAHGQDLQYVFGFPYLNETYYELFGVHPRQEYDFDYSDRNMSEFMIALFTNFSNSGNPTDLSFPPKFFRNVTWLGYDKNNHSYLLIQNKSSNQINYRQRNHAFWEDYFVEVSNRYSLYTTPEPSSERASRFETATWCLTAVGGVLIVIILSLCIVMWRMRPRDY